MSDEDVRKLERDAEGDPEDQQRLDREKSRRERPSLAFPRLVAELATRIHSAQFQRVLQVPPDAGQAVLEARRIVDLSFSGWSNQEIREDIEDRLMSQYPPPGWTQHPPSGTGTWTAPNPNNQLYPPPPGYEWTTEGSEGDDES